MHEIDNKMWEQIYNQSKTIADRGLTSSNIDMAYKLIEMYYRLKKLELMEGGEYSEAYDNNGSSYGYAGKRDARGRYSREGYANTNRYNNNYEDYVSAKRDYRNTHSMDCKKEMIDTLEMYMDNFVNEMEELARDADCAEERDTINRYIRRVKELK